MTKENIIQKLEELKEAAFFYFRDKKGVDRILHYKQIIMVDANCHQELNVEIRPYRKPVSVPNMIRVYLRKNDLTIGGFANEIGIGRSALSNYINCKSALSFELADKLANKLFTSSETLLRIDLEQRYSFYKNKNIFKKNLENSGIEIHIGNFPDLKNLKQAPINHPKQQGER